MANGGRGVSQKTIMNCYGGDEDPSENQWFLSGIFVNMIIILILMTSNVD